MCKEEYRNNCIELGVGEVLGLIHSRGGHKNLCGGRGYYLFAAKIRRLRRWFGRTERSRERSVIKLYELSKEVFL